MCNDIFFFFNVLHFYLKKNRSFPQTKAFKFTQPSSDTELCCCVKEHHETIYKMWWMWFYLLFYNLQTTCTNVWNTDPESLFSLWSFIFEDTSIRATKLLHKSKLNPVVFCECPERSDQKLRRIRDHWKQSRNMSFKNDFILWLFSTSITCIKILIQKSLKSLRVHLSILT